MRCVFWKLLSCLSLHLLDTDRPCENVTVFSVNASEGDMPKNFGSNNNYESSRLCRCEAVFFFFSFLL